VPDDWSRQPRSSAQSVAMNQPSVFVGGIHGVGKMTVSRLLAELLPAKHATAGALVLTSREPATNFGPRNGLHRSGDPALKGARGVFDDQSGTVCCEVSGTAIGHRRDVLEPQVKAADEPPPLVHPSMADLDRTKVEELAAALQREDARTEASETLRGLIDAIVLMPEKGQLRVELRGNLAAMLTAAQKTRRSPGTGDLLVPVQLVAGACNQRYLQLWSGAA